MYQILEVIDFDFTAKPSHAYEARSSGVHVSLPVDVMPGETVDIRNTSDADITVGDEVLMPYQAARMATVQLRIYRGRQWNYHKLARGRARYHARRRAERFVVVYEWKRIE